MSRPSTKAPAIGNGKVEALVHTSDRRKNIPTEELRDWMEPEEVAPTAMRYPRDAALDPQLVWKGKDEQNASELEVPTVPIYIQERIAPQALIEDLRARSAKASPVFQPQLFGDPDEMPLEQKIEFYQHDQPWTNRMILGDSLLVMNSLGEKEGLKGQVQCVYFDPPYGIKFGSNWQVSTRRRDVKDGKIEDATRQPEQIKAFRDTWELGIHSYLTFMRDRLVVTRELLTESGSIFVQIGDENVHLLRCLLDEVFGADNFLAQINFKSMGALGQSGLAKTYDYLLWYGRDKARVKYRPLFRMQSILGDPEYRFIDDSSSPQGFRQLTPEEMTRADELEGVFRRSTLTSSGYTPSCTFAFEFEGKTFVPFSNKSWRTNAQGVEKLKEASRLFRLGNNIYFKRYASDFPLIQLENSWIDAPPAFSRSYVVETATKFIERCVLMTTDPGDLVLDPTCGSGTTAFVAEQWGRRWITIDTSRVALALARTRLMSGRFPFYLLADSTEGALKEVELGGAQLPATDFARDIKQGFVNKRVPHITLGSIANNPDIRAGMSRAEIGAAINRHADREKLFDQPVEDTRRIRVSGPFTVESLSPHRVVSADEDRPASESAAQQTSPTGQFETMILDNLKKAGVQNTIKNERLVFDSLEPFAGTWIHAAGEYTESGTSRRVAVFIGPQYGTVSSDMVREAAKEAVRYFDLLVVCGFAFEASVGDDTQRLGKLTILKAKMNPDLSMGDQLLKKTGAGNLFMVIGEPDISIDEVEGGKLAVTIHGLDVYDPTTGQVRSNSTDDIACWFIDTDYDEESFFVRHAYFTGAQEPYDRLKRALRAEIDEAAWASLYSTTSQPFDRPESKKIAVKVINHYGDEVLKVYSV